MATTAQSRLREMFCRATGWYFSGTNTGTANNTVIDANIARYDTGRLRDRWVLITSGTRSGESRRILSVSGSTATLVTALSGVLANGDTFEIVPYDPNDIHDALREAIRTVWPKRVNGRGAPRGLYLPITNETLIVDNLLLNPSFENGTFTNWTNIGTPTNTANATRRVHGAQSAQIAATGATEGIEQDLLALLDIDQIVGKTLRFQGWAWASVASAVRLRVTFDGTTFTNGPWHAGGDEWEGPSIQYVTASMPAGATEATASCEVTDGNTGYFDLTSAWVDPISEYAVPTSLYPNGPYKASYQSYQDRPEGPYSNLNNGYAPAGSVLRLEGMGRLTVPTTDAGTTEVDENEAELIIAEAAAYLFRRQATIEVDKRVEHMAESDRWAIIASELRASVGHLGMGADERIWWRVSDEATKILYIQR